ncbi:hypothetical protein GIB67_036413 [Kingdonia uniflora]|uniref:Uncharacterized protein n=1 Tax=Kingdonia uniflora TaxID=39325 RepID=A0A7J7L425_9MAGN|nr:hypothetical protein GIB67_036413 [Kingdonia uniflora]
MIEDSESHLSILIPSMLGSLLHCQTIMRLIKLIWSRSQAVLRLRNEKIQCKLLEGISSTVPGQLENLIRKNPEKISCVIADETIGWALEVVQKIGIPNAAFYPAAAGFKALCLQIPKLIQADIIDTDGKNI